MRKRIITFTTWKINNKERWHLEKYFDHQKENMITIFLYNMFRIMIYISKILW